MRNVKKNIELDFEMISDKNPPPPKKKKKKKKNNHKPNFLIFEHFLGGAYFSNPVLLEGEKEVAEEGGCEHAGKKHSPGVQPPPCSRR